MNDEFNFNFASSSPPPLSNHPYIIMHFSDMLTPSLVGFPLEILASAQNLLFSARLALLLNDAARSSSPLMQSLRFDSDCSYDDWTRIRWTKGNHRNSSIRQRWPRDYSRASPTAIHIRCSPLCDTGSPVAPTIRIVALAQTRFCSMTAWDWRITSSRCPLPSLLSSHCPLDILSAVSISPDLLVDLKAFTSDSSEDSLVLD